MDENRARRERQQKSILDFVLEDARQLKANLGYTDRRKLDEYLTAVRELESRIERARTSLPFSRTTASPRAFPRTTSSISG